MNKSKYIISFVILIAVFLAIATPVFAQYGLKETGEAAGFVQGGQSRTLSQIIAIIINVLLSLVGIGFLVLLIYAGFTWMTARDDKNAAENAMKTIKNAVAGLLIVLAAYAITTFVFSRLVKPIGEPGVAGEGVYEMLK